MQTFSGSGPKIEYNPSFFILDKDRNSNTRAQKAIKLQVAEPFPLSRSLLEHNFAALNIINGNIIPPNIQPPAPIQRIEDPTKDERRNIDTPTSSIVNEITEKNLDNLLSIDLPPLEGQTESYEAAYMIEIRRLKMKKHRLKKWRKKFKFDVAKKKLKRRMQREKEFQASLLAQIRDAEKFSAEDYVNDKLARMKIAPERKPEIIRVL